MATETEVNAAMDAILDYASLAAVDELAKRLCDKMERLDPSDGGPIKWEGRTEMEREFYRISVRYLLGFRGLVKAATPSESPPRQEKADVDHPTVLTWREDGGVVIYDPNFDGGEPTEPWLTFDDGPAWTPQHDAYRISVKWEKTDPAVNATIWQSAAR